MSIIGIKHIKNICCIGAGYVGGPTMAVIALKCPDIKITIVDEDHEKIQRWNSDSLPVYEPGLYDIIRRTRNKNLFFSDNIYKSIRDSEMIFIAVNTPTKTSGPGKGMQADISNVVKCAKKIALFAESDKIVIEKSTLPIRTAEKIKEILDKSETNLKFEIISNPEFLAEGSAIQDLFKSDRVLIGREDTKSGIKASKFLEEIYERWIPKEKILTTNVWSSELSKLISNAMLAQRISSINSMSSLCEKTGANIDEVSRAVGMDRRIGPQFLKVSLGFGGSCFKKDILNLVYLLRYYGLTKEADYWFQVIQINTYQTERFGEIIAKKFKSNTINKNISILGWSFKKNTNDSRESASIYLSKFLLTKKFKLKIYDPMIPKNRIIEDLQNIGLQKSKLKHVQILSNLNDALNDSNAAVICTEWDEFKFNDWQESLKIMRKNPIIFDGRALLNINLLEKIGFKIFTLGK